jgi:hypothetical protein
LKLPAAGSSPWELPACRKLRNAPCSLPREEKKKKKKREKKRKKIYI